MKLPSCVSRTAAPGLLVSALCLTVLSGCSANFDPVADSTPVQTAIGAIAGTVHGGQGPISGASVYLYQVSTSAYGGASTLLAGPVITNINGGFSFSTYLGPCITNVPVYLYSVGGNSGAGPNSGAGLLAALGICSTTGNLGTSYPSVNMNELSTVAMAYALAGFATDATHIGYSGSSLGRSGIDVAFYNATAIFPANFAPFTTSTAPSAPLLNPNGTLPAQLINTLADVLAQCINSGSPTSSACTSDPTAKGLFYYATSTGAVGGTVPTDTATAAIYIAQHPASNVAALWGLAGGIGSPFQTALTSAPTDLTIAIHYVYNYSGGSYGASLKLPRELAVDGFGNIWSANGANTLFEFSPEGGGNHYTDPSLSTAVAVAADNGLGSGIPLIYTVSESTARVTRFNSATGVESLNYLTASSSNAAPVDIAIDFGGNVWTPNIGDPGGGSLGDYNPGGTGLVTLDSTVTGGALNAPVGIAAVTGGDVITADSGDQTTFVFTSAGVGSVQSTTGAGPAGAVSVAVDGARNSFFTFAGGVNKVTTGGTVTSSPVYTTSGEAQNSIAIDGAGNIWTTASDNTGDTGEIFEFDSSTLLPLNGTYGFTVPSGSPCSLVVDGSGDVWYNNDSVAGITEIIGVATPVATPLAYGVLYDQLGTRP